MPHNYSTAIAKHSKGLKRVVDDILVRVRRIDEHKIHSTIKRRKVERAGIAVELIYLRRDIATQIATPGLTLVRVSDFMRMNRGRHQ